MALSTVPFLGSFCSNFRLSTARNYLSELGVRPLINAAGTYTRLTGSLMPPEVIQAWEYASQIFVRLDELHDAVGERIASLVEAEAAMVTAGAASALTLGTAACMTGSNEEFIRALPDTTSMRDEVIIQKSHRFSYEHAVRNCGIRMVEIETPEEFENTVSERTAMMLFLNKNEPVGQIKAAEFAQLGQKHGVPTFIDGAADVPPVENLSKFLRLGYDLVTFSGGKGILGPQSAGLLLGRKDLIKAARLNTLPHANTIGRGMKVNKEELLAMMVAVELYVKRDHQKDWDEWEKRVELIAEQVKTIPGVQSETFVPEIANQTPHLRIRWDQSKTKIRPSEVAQRLREGEPSIEVRPNVEDSLEVSVWMLQPGEDQIVARRITETLSLAS
ncbi:aminotransferase class V-fold PLP-dependent enzyme [Acidobacteria bacterium AH-259-L09]|nr:aminotransferase class V-fold PLP-dependent enzyme [Acidobacteria bacterium AH-259-L09]